MYNGAPIAWICAQQGNVTLSSMEAELGALVTVTKELTWIMRILSELHITTASPATVYSDNISCIHVAKNPDVNKRAKHICIYYQFLKEQVHDKAIEIKWISSSKNLADMLTKPLSAASHNALVRGLFGI